MEFNFFIFYPYPTAIKIFALLFTQPLKFQVSLSILSVILIMVFYKIILTFPIYFLISYTFSQFSILILSFFSDDDMISNFSHVSDDDEEYRRLTFSAVDEDIGGTVIYCPGQQAKSNAGILQSRANQLVALN